VPTWEWRVRPKGAREQERASSGCMLLVKFASFLPKETRQPGIDRNPRSSERGGELPGGSGKSWLMEEQLKEGLVNRGDLRVATKNWGRSRLPTERQEFWRSRVLPRRETDRAEEKKPICIKLLFSSGNRGGRERSLTKRRRGNLPVHAVRLEFRPWMRGLSYRNQAPLVSVRTGEWYRLRRVLGGRQRCLRGVERKAKKRSKGGQVKRVEATWSNRRRVGEVSRAGRVPGPRKHKGSGR